MRWQPDVRPTATCCSRARLGVLGDDDPLEVRRARAVGILADPQRALDLLAGTDPGHTKLKPAATLYLHLDESALLDLDAFPAAIGVEGLGTVSSDLLATWLADASVVVEPVLDLARSDAVDGHDPPAWMADLVRLRDATCVFPGCRRPSRSCDLDHIEPYLPPDDGGPPRQTRAANTPVPTPPPREDPRPLGLLPPARRQLPLDQPDRPHPRD